MNISLGTVIIYARDMHKSAQFYSSHFGFETTGKVVEGLIELCAVNGGEPCIERSDAISRPISRPVSRSISRPISRSITGPIIGPMDPPTLVLT